MILSLIFEDRRKLNALVLDLYRQDMLSESKLNKLERKRWFGYAFFFPVLFLGCFCLMLPFIALYECHLNNVDVCFDKGSVKMFAVNVIAGIICLWVFCTSMKQLVKGELRLVSLMTHGRRVKGRWVDAAVIGPRPPGAYYRCDYTFHDNDGNMIEGRSDVPLRPRKKKYKEGDEIVIAYNLSDPNENICVLDHGFDNYDLKISF